MNIIIKKVEFLDAIEKLNKIAKSKTLSLCDNILCVVNNDKIMLSATNLEIQASIQISGQINEPGQCLIPAKKVLNIVKELDTDLIFKTIDDRQIDILAGGTSFKTYTEDANDFPLLNNDNNVLCKCVVQKNHFLDSIDKMLAVKPTIDEKRSHITCINIRIKPTTLHLASTDGFRLYYSKFNIFNVVEKNEFKIDCLIPKNEIKHLKAFCKNTLQTEINIIIKKRCIVFVIDDIEIIILLHEGAFPDYSNIINDNDVSESFNVDTKPIIKACKTIKAVDKNCNNHAQFRIAYKCLRLTAWEDNSEIECNIKTDFDQDIINEYYIDPSKLNCFVQSSKKESLTIQVVKNSFIKTEFDNNVFVLMFKAK